MEIEEFLTITFGKTLSTQSHFVRTNVAFERTTLLMNNHSLLKLQKLYLEFFQLYNVSSIKKKLRNYVRVRTNYISPEQANKVKNKLAVVYALTAWNLFGFVVLSIYKEKIPKTHDSYDYAKVLGVQESKVVKFSGFTKVDEYDQTLTSEDLREFRETIGSKEEKAKYEAQNEERMRKLQK